MGREEGYIKREDDTAAHVRGRLLEDYPEVFSQTIDGQEEHTDATKDLFKMNREELLLLEKKLRSLSQK